MAVTFLSKLGDEIVSFTFFMWRHCPSLWYTVVLQGISAGGRGLTLLHFFPKHNHSWERSCLPGLR